MNTDHVVGVGAGASVFGDGFAWMLVFLCVQVTWIVVACRARFVALAVFLPGPWFLLRTGMSMRRLVLEQSRERAALRCELATLLEYLSASSASGLHLRQCLPREGSQFKSHRLRDALAAVEQARVLGFDVNASLQSQGLLLLARQGEERYLGQLFLSLALSERLGANTTRLLEALRTRLEERLALLRKVRIDTAQVRLQATVLCLAPFCFGTGYALVFPARFAFFLSSVTGGVLLAVAIGATSLGGFLTWRLVSRWTDSCA
jgi:Flp pilus assembly protein TadB